MGQEEILEIISKTEWQTAREINKKINGTITLTYASLIKLLKYNEIKMKKVLKKLNYNNGVNTLRRINVYKLKCN